MTAPLVIELAGEPRGKGRPRFSRRTGHAFTPAETRSYEGALRYAAQQAMAGQIPLSEPLCIVVTAVFSVPASWSRRKRSDALAGILRPATRPDPDNIMKMMDALNEVVWRDDKQVVDAHIAKFYGDRPRLTIEVRPVPLPIERPSPILTLFPGEAA